MRNATRRIAGYREIREDILVNNTLDIALGMRRRGEGEYRAPHTCTADQPARREQPHALSEEERQKDLAIQDCGVQTPCSSQKYECDVLRAVGKTRATGCVRPHGPAVKIWTQHMGTR
eukprot:3590503-Rhodomonas_salina.2